MKISTLVLSALCLQLEAHSQGFIAFNNYGINGSPIAPIYGPEVNSPQEQKWGNAAEAIPSGVQTYTGIPLAGANYIVEGWYSLTPVADIYELNTAASVLLNSTSTFLPNGLFARDDAYIPVIPNVGNPGVYLQVRAWDNGGGQFSTWTEAWEAAMAGSGKAVGWSKVFWQDVAQGAAPPAGLRNFESFNIFIVPEPSTFALLGLGGLVCGLVLLLLRRRT
jgi:hypothetical protein